MNRGQLNGHALNGLVLDPVVRVRVGAKGYAMGRVQGRVLAYAVVDATGCARQSGIVGRVEANLSARATAQAVVAGVLGRVNLRSLLQVTGRVIVDVKLPPIYGRVEAYGKAKASIRAHSIVRGQATSSPQADMDIVGRRLRRGPVVAKPKAMASADGKIYIRRWLRSLTHSDGVAFIVSTSRVDARLAALTQAKAIVSVGGHALRRSPVASQGVVLIEIDEAIHKHLPFDEPAPDSRTFRVPEAMTTFYVTDQGASMFRVSPPMQPADTQDYDIEFDGWFPPGDEIVGVQLKVEPAMPMPPSYAIASQRVKVWVYAGGTSGEKYKISVTATTNDGRVKEVDLIVPIKEV